MGSTFEITLLLSVVCLAVSITAAAQETQPKNGCTDPEYSQSDFWVGIYSRDRNET